MKTPVWIVVLPAFAGFAFCSCFCGCDRGGADSIAFTADDQEMLEGLLSVSPGVSGRAGPLGQPPAELRSFVAPLKIVTASRCEDEASVFVRMADSRGFEIDLCVTRCPNDEPYPANTMLIGGENVHSKSARRPLSDRESMLVVSSLEEAAGTLSSDEPGYVLVTDALEGLKSVPKQRLATREEIEIQRAGLEKVSLDALAAEFRETVGEDRSALWDELLPLLTLEFCESPPKDPEQYIVNRIGPSESDAEERMAGVWQRSSDIGFLAYQLNETGDEYVDTACHIRSNGAIQFGTLRHDKIGTESSD